MKKWLFGAVGLFALIVGVEAVSVQRTMSLEYQKVELAASQVQNVLARQAELIPNLAEVAMGYAKHEKETFAQYAAGRSLGVYGTTAEDVAKSPELQKKLNDAAVVASNALASFRSVQEANPKLQANENFRSLMAELSGSINRVTVERRKFQQAIKDYNVQIVQFPTNVFAGVVGYKALPFYQAPETDQRAPKLNLTKG